MKFKDDLQKYLYYKAQSDYCYWRLREITKELNKPRSIIESMIDETTGYDKRHIPEIKSLCRTAIRCCKKINEDYAMFRKILNATSKTITNPPSKPGV